MFRVTYIEIYINNEENNEENHLICIWRNKKVVIIDEKECKKSKKEIEDFFEYLDDNDDIEALKETYFDEKNKKDRGKWAIKFRYNKNKIKSVEGNVSFTIFGNDLIQKFYELTEYKYNIKGEEYLDFKESLKDVYEKNLSYLFKINSSDVVRYYKSNMSIDKTSKITGYKKSEVKKILKRAKVITNDSNRSRDIEDNGLSIRDFL